MYKVLLTEKEYKKLKQIRHINESETRINYFYDGTPITATTFSDEALRTFEAEKEFQEWRESADEYGDFTYGLFRAKKCDRY